MGVDTKRKEQMQGVCNMKMEGVYVIEQIRCRYVGTENKKYTAAQL